MTDDGKLVMRSALFIIVAWLGLMSGALGHESRPAYLEITELAPDRYDVIWRTPLLSGMRLPVVLKLPAEVRDIIEPATRQLPDSIVERRRIEIGNGVSWGAIALSPQGTLAILNWSGTAGHGIDLIDVDPASDTYGQVVASPIVAGDASAGAVVVSAGGAFAFASSSDR